MPKPRPEAEGGKQIVCRSDDIETHETARLNITEPRWRDAVRGPDGAMSGRIISAVHIRRAVNPTH
eukprot:11161153-Lingulodinium_polyedra.AAC.1